MSERELECPVCHKLFIQSKRNQVYCSRSCYKKAYNRRLAVRGLCVFEPRVCEVCGKTFLPTTTNQRTCGGHCTAVYMHQHHGKRDPDKPQRSGRHTPEWKEYKASLLIYGQDAMTNIKKKVYVETSKTFLDQLEPNVGSSDTRIVLAQKAIRTAMEIDSLLPDWRTKYNLPQQAALLNLAVGIGVHKMLGNRDIYKAVQDKRTADIKSLILQRAWASLNPKRVVRMCRQIESGFWE